MVQKYSREKFFADFEGIFSAIHENCSQAHTIHFKMCNPRNYFVKSPKPTIYEIFPGEIYPLYGSGCVYYSSLKVLRDQLAGHPRENDRIVQHHPGPSLDQVLVLVKCPLIMDTWNK